MIRNKFGAHTDIIAMESGYDAFPASETLVDFFAEETGNSLYCSGEMITVFAMSKLGTGKSWHESLDQIAREITDVSLLFQTLFQGYMEIFAERHLERHVGDPLNHSITLPDGPRTDEVHLPFFCTRPLHGHGS